jgi:2-dehydropantoate 2-reductase
MTALTITVIGAGSVGLAVAASLAKAGQDVTLAAREGSVVDLQNSAVTLSGMLGSHEVPAGQITIIDAAAPSHAARGCDMLIVTTKAQGVATALTPFSALGPKPKAVLSLQNGLGSSEAARAVMGPNVPIYASAMMIGFVRQDLSHVAITAVASPILTGALLGDPQSALEAFVAASKDGFVPFEVNPNIRDKIYSKLLFNACMNPTGALADMTYGALVESLHTLGLIKALADETLAVFAAQSGFAPFADGKSYARDNLVPRGLAHGSGHRSSMVQDMEAGRPTEIDALNGAVARLGVQHGVPTPTHDAVIALIKAHEPA